MLTSGAFLTIFINNSMNVTAVTSCLTVALEVPASCSNRSHQGFNCRYLASQQLKICYTGYGNGHDEWNREELETLNAGGHELELHHLYNFCEELLTYQEHIKYKRPQC